jgi:hypothetical protein
MKRRLYISYSSACQSYEIFSIVYILVSMYGEDRIGVSKKAEERLAQ